MFGVAPCLNFPFEKMLYVVDIIDFLLAFGGELTFLAKMLYVVDFIAKTLTFDAE